VRLDISKPPALYTVTYCNTLIRFGASTDFCGLTSTQRQILNPIYQKGRKFLTSAFFRDFTQLRLVVTDLSERPIPWRWDWEAVPKRR